MKKQLQAMLQKKEGRKQELVERAKVSEDVTELRGINTEMDGLNGEIAELRNMLDSLPEDETHPTPAVTVEDDSEAQRSFNPIASYTVGNQVNKRQEDEDIHGTLQYRKAFMDYVTKGTEIPQEFRQTKLSESELTVVGDVGAVIPTNVLNKVIEDMTVEGKILARVTQTAYQGGVEIPISEINPTATWIGSETQVSADQKAEMKARLKFGYHLLEARVAIGLLSATVTLPVFEKTVVKQLKKAMIRAIEIAIIEGTGEGQPLGIAKYSLLPAEQQLNVTTETIGTVKQWAEVEAAIPEVVEDGLIYMMAKQTWEKYLNGMTDTTGQKIGLGKINEKGQRILNGREVLLTDRLPGFDACEVGGIFAVLVDLSQYMLNSNLAMYYKKYFDENTNKFVHKSLMITDGKMPFGEVPTTNGKKLVGAQGLLYLKKANVVVASVDVAADTKAGK